MSNNLALDRNTCQLKLCLLWILYINHFSFSIEKGTMMLNKPALDL